MTSPAFVRPSPGASTSDDPIVERVAAWLEWPDDAIGRLRELPDPSGAFQLPSAAEAYDTLRKLDVPAPAAAEMASALPSPNSSPEAWWLLERLYAAVIARTGAPPWPAPVVGEDALSRYFHLYAFLAAVPNVLDTHARRGVPEETTFGTLEDVGLQVAHHHFRHGFYGFDGAFWVWEHFCGDVFRLGRLTFNRTTVNRDGCDVPAIAVHIPSLGPLTPAACDASFDRARRFYARHFPDFDASIAVCTSWLMDDQLARYLPDTSNIVSFQRRFRVTDEWSREGDDDVIRFVFGWLPSSLDELPQDTSLQRAVVEHLRAGRHWWIRRGWFDL